VRLPLPLEHLVSERWAEHLPRSAVYLRPFVSQLPVPGFHCTHAVFFVLHVGFKHPMQTLLTYVTSIDRGAELTIIAAAGSNPHYGLLGISRPRKPQAILSISSHTFVAVEDPSYEIQNSTWDRRAWTFQEALFRVVASCSPIVKFTFSACACTALSVSSTVTL
jgi:hypothetical protein